MHQQVLQVNMERCGHQEDDYVLKYQRVASDNTLEVNQTTIHISLDQQ